MRLVKDTFNGWSILENREECTICEKERKIGKILFDSFVCSNCVESLGASE